MIVDYFTFTIRNQNANTAGTESMAVSTEREGRGEWSMGDVKQREMEKETRKQAQVTHSSATPPGTNIPLQVSSVIPQPPKIGTLNLLDTLFWMSSESGAAPQVIDSR